MNKFQKNEDVVSGVADEGVVFIPYVIQSGIKKYLTLDYTDDEENPRIIMCDNYDFASKMNTIHGEEAWKRRIEADDNIKKPCEFGFVKHTRIVTIVQEKTFKTDIR